VLVGPLFAQDKRLCYALLWMEYWDQAARRPWAVYAPWWRHEVDRHHARRMASIIARDGWPSVSCVGPLGADAAWVLVQHADHDPVFQRRCLALVEDAVRRGEASPRNLAYLTDRVLVAEGRPQMYGTQFQGGRQPLPIDDAAHVDDRRAAVGLSPLAAYVAQIRHLTPPKDTPKRARHERLGGERKI